MVITHELIQANFPWTSHTDLPEHEGTFYRYQDTTACVRMRTRWP